MRNDVGGVTFELKAEPAQFTQAIDRGQQKLAQQSAEMKKSLQGVATQTNQTHATVTKQFDSMGRAASNLSKQFLALGVGFSAVAAVREVSRLSDSYTGLSSKLKVVTQSQADYNRVFQQLFDISQRNRASFEDSVTAFQNLSAVGKDLGASSNDLLKLTDIVQKLGKISGAGPMDMANGLRGLTQALASGNVQADEFRQISDNLPGLANQIASAAGLSLGQLRKLVKEGKVSSKDLYDLTMKSAGDVEKKYQQVGSTISGAFVQMGNALTVATGKIDQSIGVTNKLAKEFESLSKWITEASNAFIKWNNDGLTMPGSDGKQIRVRPSDMLGEGFKTGGQFVKDMWGDGTLAPSAANLKRFQVARYALTGAEQFNSSLDKKDLDAKAKYFPTAAEMSANGFPLRQKSDPFKFTGTGKKGDGKSDAEKQLERELALVENIVSKRKEEALELAQKSSGMDQLAIQFDREKRQIEETIIGEKSKKKALDDLAASYADIRKQEAFEATRKAQKEQEDDLKKLIEQVKRKNSELKFEIEGRKNLNEVLRQEAELKKIIAQGNKGSKGNAILQEDAANLIAQAKSDAIAKDAADIVKDAAKSEKEYQESLDETVRGLREHREELERRLHGEQDLSNFVHARNQIEKQYNEELEKRKKKLTEIQQLLDLEPGNLAVQQNKLAVEAAITKAQEDRTARLASVDEEQKATLKVNEALTEQKNLLEDIVHSTAKNTEKVKLLTDAYDQGKITAEQYNDTLRKIKDSHEKVSTTAKGLFGGITSGLSSILSGQRSVSEGFKQMGIDLGNFVAKRFLLAPLEKALGRLFDNFTGGLFGGIGGGGLVGGLVGTAAGKSLSGLAAGLAAPTTGTATPSSGVVNPAMALPMMAASGDVEIQKAELEKARFDLPVFRAARLPDAILRDPDIVSSRFENSRYKENDFYDSIFWDVVFREGTLDRGFFKAGWFDTAQFRKPLLDGATIKNATIEGVAGAGGGQQPGLISGFGGYVGGRVAGMASSLIEDRIFMGLRNILGFAEGGFYGANMGPVWVGEQGPELFYPGTSGYIMNSQMSMGMMGGASAMLPRAGSFAFGSGGVTGGGQISFQDHASLQAQISKQLYEAAYAKAQRGEFPDGWQLENLRAKAQLDAQEAASGQSRSFFTRPEFAPQWEQYNSQIRELQALGGNFDLESGLANLNLNSLRGQNTGAQWAGFTAAGLSSSSMGGDVGVFTGGGGFSPATSNFSIGSSFAGGGYQPSLVAHVPGATAFSNPFNGGMPLAGGGIGGGGTSTRTVPGGVSATSSWRGGGWSDFDPPMIPRMDDRVFPRGLNFDGSMDMFDIFGRKLSAADTAFETRIRQPMTMEDLQAQTVRAMALPFQVTDSFDVRANNSSVFGGGDFGGSRDLSGSLNPRYIGPYSPQFYNNAMNSAAIFGGMLGSGSVRRYAKGGKFSKNQPFIAGDEGRAELILPAASEGRVVPNSQIREAMGGAPNINIQVINNAPVNVKTTQQVRPDGTVNVIMRIIENAARDPRHPLNRTIQQVAAGSR